MSFVRPRELVSFDAWHVTHSPPIRKVLDLGGITITSFQSRWCQVLQRSSSLADETSPHSHGIL